MPDLGGFAQIAPYLTHPLVLAGFGLLLFFWLLRVVVKSGVMPTVSQKVGGQALLNLLRYGFVLALAVLVLGFALAFYQAQRTTLSADQIYRDFKAAKEADAASQGTLAAIERLTELEDGTRSARGLRFLHLSEAISAPAYTPPNTAIAFY